MDPETGEPYQTQFEPDDVALFEKQTADELTAQPNPKAEVEELLYVRELNDYEYRFLEIERQGLALVTKIASTQRDGEDIKLTTDRVKQQIVSREEEITKLQQDLQNHNEELQLVTQHREKLQRDWKALQDEIRRLYFTNKYYESQLAAMHQQLTQEIQRRAREAVSAGAG